MISNERKKAPSQAFAPHISGEGFNSGERARCRNIVVIETALEKTAVKILPQNKGDLWGPH